MEKKMKKMDPKVKANWLTALRSDAFKKCEGALCTVQKTKKGEKCEFCVLGVLAEVQGVPRSTDKYGDTAFRFGKRTEESSVPPDSFLKSVGLTHKTAQELYTKNDDGESFKSIADYIEQNL